MCLYLLRALCAGGGGAAVLLHPSPLSNVSRSPCHQSRDFGKQTPRDRHSVCTSPCLDSQPHMVDDQCILCNEGWVQNKTQMVVGWEMHH